MRRRPEDLGVVSSVQEQTDQAAALAAIAGQARLADPRTNPATRGHADRLRDEQHLKALDAEHARMLRRHRVADARAGEAERTLEAIALAQRASSPARSVLALHVGKRSYLRISLAASLTLACGSALGVEATARVLGAPWGSGYIAEVGLTGLATAAITYRAHLAEHGGTLVKGSWQSRVLWTAMTVPLLVSVACNLGTANVVGAACAVFAAAWSLLSCVIADRSSAAMAARAEEVSSEDEQEIRRVAMGDDLFVPVVPEVAEEQGQGDADAGPAPRVTDPVADEASAGVDELEAWLADSGPEEPGEGGVRPVPDPGGDGGPDGAAADLDSGGGHIDLPGGHIGGHIESGQRDDGAAVLPAAEARRALGASTRHRIGSYLAEHPRATQRQIAAGLGLSEATVKRHLRGLRGRS